MLSILYFRRCRSACPFPFVNVAPVAFVRPCPFVLRVWTPGPLLSPVRLIVLPHNAVLWGLSCLRRGD